MRLDVLYLPNVTRPQSTNKPCEPSKKYGSVTFKTKPVIQCHSAICSPLSSWSCVKENAASQRCEQHSLQYCLFITFDIPASAMLGLNIARIVHLCECGSAQPDPAILLEFQEGPLIVGSLLLLLSQ